MVFNEEKVKSRHEGLERVLALLSEKNAQFDTTFLVVSSYEETIRCKKALAEVGLSLGVQVITLPHLVEDRWELFGAGKPLVSAEERALFLNKVIRTHLVDESVLPKTSGIFSMLEQIIIEAAPTIAEYECPNDSERELKALVQKYIASLEESGRMEYSFAVEYLARKSVFAQCGMVLLDVETTVLEERLLQTAAWLHSITITGYEEDVGGRSEELSALQRMIYRSAGNAPITPQGSLSLSLPVGRYAKPALIAQDIRVLCNSEEIGSIAVATTTPLDLFLHVEERVHACDACICASERIAFCQTDFGRAWLSIVSFSHEEGFPDASLATDFALTAFSGLTTAGIHICDSRWRGWRGQTVDEAMIDLIGFSSDDMQGILALIDTGEYLAALDSYRELVFKRAGWSEAYKAVQLQAIAYARTIYVRTQEIEADISDYLATLENASLNCSVVISASPNDKKHITIMTLRELADHQGAEFDAVVLCDLEADSYLLREGLTAKDLFMQKRGLYKERDELNILRMEFARALSTAKKRVIVSRILSTDDGEACLPAITFEELIDCYRADLQDPDELDSLYGVTSSLLPYVATRGDNKIGENLSQDGHEALLAVAVPLYTTGTLIDIENFSRILIRTRTDESQIPILSPSAIESFLECPYQWVATKRFDSSGIDAGLGPLEFGNFAHAALERFYSRFKEYGHLRVEPNNLSEAKEVFCRVFDDLFSEQESLPPGEVLLLACNEIERAEVQGLKKDLVSLLEREAVLLPAFRPAYFELDFGFNEVCEYAGVAVQGRIDRIDVDGFGNAVVIDYKGSVDKKFVFGDREDEPFRLPRKVQTLIYAQIARRILGLNPLASLYLSYRKPGLYGAYDAVRLHPINDLGNAKVEECSVRDFGSLLDKVEQEIALRLESMQKGTVNACPVDATACAYCPVTLCSARDLWSGSVM